MFYLHSKDILAEKCIRSTKGLCQNSLKRIERGTKGDAQNERQLNI